MYLDYESIANIRSELKESTMQLIRNYLNKSSEQNKPKVIFNPPATILFINGKKYVSKAHNEPFDEEKGLLMCLAKAQGITHLELKRMIKGAIKQKTKRSDYE